MKLAIIDLGTNSVRFDVYDISSIKKIRRIHREKQLVRLGDGVFQTGKLNSDAIDRTLGALKNFKKTITQSGVNKVVAIATSALRDAQDQKKFLQEVKENTGIELQVISGVDEAKLIAKGILNNIHTPKHFFALVDIGGGSTEISICFKRTLVTAFSFDLGVNRLKQLFLSNDNGNHSDKKQEGIKKLRAYIQKTLKSGMTMDKPLDTRTVIGSSGTIRSLEHLIERTHDKTNPFKRKALSKLVDKMSGLDRKGLLKIPGMEEKRVDLILPGALLFEEVMLFLQADRAFITDYALRDGVFVQELENLFGPVVKS